MNGFFGAASFGATSETGDIGDVFSVRDASPDELLELLIMAPLELLLRWCVLASAGRRRDRDATSAAGLLTEPIDTDLRLTGAAANITGTSMCKGWLSLRIDCVCGGGVPLPSENAGSVMLSSGSVTSATERRLV